MRTGSSRYDIWRIALNDLHQLPDGALFEPNWNYTILRPQYSNWPELRADWWIWLPGMLRNKEIDHGLSSWAAARNCYTELVRMCDMPWWELIVLIEAASCDSQTTSRKMLTLVLNWRSDWAELTYEDVKQLSVSEYGMDRSIIVK